MIIFSLKKIAVKNLISLVVAVSLLLICFQPGYTATETETYTAEVDITFEDDLISAELVSVPLIDVLQRIRAEFGFKAHFHGDLSTPVTLSFRELPLEKCLKQLTTDHSLSVAYSASSKESAQPGNKQVAEIWVLSHSGKPRTISKAARPMISLPVRQDESVASADESMDELDEDDDILALEQLLGDPDSNRASQRQAIQNLAKTGDTASLMAMAEFLDSEDKELRQLLVNGISSIQSEQSTQLLGLVVQDEVDPEIRKIALWALGKRKDDETAQIFLEEALLDEDDEVKSLAEQILEQ